MTVEAGGNRQALQVMPTKSYLSQSELPLTFGLGRAPEAESVTVRWPSSRVSRLGKTKADQALEVAEPAAEWRAQALGQRHTTCWKTAAYTKARNDVAAARFRSKWRRQCDAILKPTLAFKFGPPTRCLGLSIFRLIIFSLVLFLIYKLHSTHHDHNTMNDNTSTGDYTSIIAQLQEKREAHLRHAAELEQTIRQLSNLAASVPFAADKPIEIESNSPELHLWGKERIARVKDGVLRKLDPEETTQTRILRTIILQFEVGQEFNSSTLAELIKEIRPELYPDDKIKFNIFRGLARTAAEALVKRGVLERVSGGRGAGNESRFRVVKLSSSIR